jgi:hypothetical protein
MSHISRIELKVKDLKALETACLEMGYEFIEGQQTYKWFGKWVGDSELPAGVDVSELGTCDNAIRVPGASYEIGVKKMAEGHCEMLFDYWSSGGLAGKVEPLLQPYAIAATKRLVKKNRYRMIGEKQLEDGAVQMRIRM